MRRRDREARAAAEARGRAAERRAAIWLTLKGYRILARRVRTPAGEIDLVARKGAVLAFVEVKLRGSLDDALFSLSPRQAERTARAAALFRAARPGLQRLTPRFDLVAVAPGRLPRHLIGVAAPDAETATRLL